MKRLWTFLFTPMVAMLLLSVFASCVPDEGAQSPPSTTEPPAKTEATADAPKADLKAGSASESAPYPRKTYPHIKRNRYEPFVDNVYVDTDESILPAHVAITFKPMWHGKHAPEMLSAITDVTHHDLMGSDYAKSTTMSHLGDGRFITDKPAECEEENGWRVRADIFDEVHFFRSTTLTPNAQGIINFGEVEIYLEDYLKDKSLARGVMTHASGYSLAQVEGGEWRLELSLQRENAKDYETSIAVRVNQDGSFFVGLPHELKSWGAQHRPASQSDLKSMKLRTEFGGEWSIQGEKEGILDLGRSQVPGVVVETTLQVKLPEGFCFDDEVAEADEIPISHRRVFDEVPSASLEGLGGPYYRLHELLYVGAGRFRSAGFAAAGPHIVELRKSGRHYSFSDELVGIEAGKLYRQTLEHAFPVTAVLRVRGSDGKPAEEFSYQIGPYQGPRTDWTIDVIDPDYQSNRKRESTKVVQGAEELIMVSGMATISIASPLGQVRSFTLDGKRKLYDLHLEEAWPTRASKPSKKKAESQLTIKIDTGGVKLPEGTILHVESNYSGDERPTVYKNGAFAPLVYRGLYERGARNDRSKLKWALFARDPRWGFDRLQVSEWVVMKLAKGQRELTLHLSKGPRFEGYFEGPWKIQVLVGDQPAGLNYPEIPLEGLEVNANEFRSLRKELEGLRWRYKEDAYEIVMPTRSKLECRFKRGVEVSLGSAFTNRFPKLEIEVGGVKMLYDKSNKRQFLPPFQGGIKNAKRNEIVISGFIEGESYILRKISGSSALDGIELFRPLTPLLNPNKDWNWELYSKETGSAAYNAEAARPGRYQWLYKPSNKVLHRGPFFDIPDQDKPFRLPKPAPRNSTFSGRIQFDVSNAQLREVLIKEVRPIVVEVDSRRRTFAEFSDSNAGHETFRTTIKIVDGKLEIGGLPLARKLILLFESSKDNYLASAPMPFELTTSAAHDGGAFPTLRGVVRPEGLTYLDKEQEKRAWKESFNFDRSIEYELYRAGKRVGYDGRLFLGEAYEIWLWRKGSKSKEPMVKLSFKPEVSEKTWTGEKMGWERDAQKKIQPLLRLLPHNYSLD